MSTLQTFRHYTICQDRHGATVEVWRGADEVACLAFDNQQRTFVELHVSIGPAERSRDAPSFQNLVQLAAPLRHRHLLGIIEGGEDEGANYHVSEYLDGERLDGWLARCHPLPPWLALLVIRQLVDGLAALASHPRLLAGVEVFHAGLTLAGPHPDDLTVKICDLGLSGSLPVSTEPQFVEARAIHDTGRLLLYMLTGSLTGGPVTAESLASRRVPPELSFLLGTIFTATLPHHPRTLEQLRTLLERCTHDFSPELTTLPPSLPAAFRPSLPLAAHLPEATETAEAVSGDFTVDTRPADAADPYRHRGTERATRRSVNVQVLPPPNLLPSPFVLPDLEKAWTALASARDPHLLAPLAFHPEGRSPVIIEELPGKWTLDTIRRLRHPLEPGEVLLLLTQLDAAAAAAGSRGLPLHWRAPRLIPIQFTAPGGEAALPPSAQLARLPLTEWPAFTLKVRTWPLTLDFSQPDRFQLERLLGRDPALTGEPAAPKPAPAALPTARDFALLSTWLLGGTSQVNENLKPLLYAAISARGPALSSRTEFLDRFRQGLGAPQSPNAPVTLLDYLTAPTSTAAKLRTKSRFKTSQVPAPSSKTPFRTGPVHPAAPAPGPVLANETPREAFPIGQHASLTEEELPALGFAEALFGPSPEYPAHHPLFPGDAVSAAHPSHFDPAPDSASPLWPILPDDFSDAGSPLPTHDGGAALGFMEAAGHSEHPWDKADSPGPGASPATSRWILFLVVVLIAAALAALMAQLSGQAIWLK